MVDEAYIHFSDAPSCIDMVKAGKDVVVLRTFSKLYGMAGLRCGFAIARPDLLKKIDAYGGMDPMPVTANAAAIASLKDASLVEQAQGRQHCGSPRDLRLAQSRRLHVLTVRIELLHAEGE